MMPIADEVKACMAACPNYLDFPTAWAIQKHQAGVTHKERCSSVPEWHPLSGPAILCDCGAVEAEYAKIKESMNG